jgi:phospholipase/carboxylesterase
VTEARPATPFEEWRIPQQSAAYCDVDIPRGAEPAPLLVALHGYGGNKRSMARLARLAAPERFAVASLQGPHPHLVRPEDGSKPLGFGFGWVTNFKPEESIALHHHAIDQIFERMRVRGGVDLSAVYLLGFSQSVAMNFRYAFSRPGKIRGVVAIAGGIPGDWSEEGKYRDAAIDVLYLGGRTDEFYPPDRIGENARRLEARGARVRVEILEMGHDLAPASLSIVRDWLDEKALPSPGPGDSLARER